MSLSMTPSMSAPFLAKASLVRSGREQGHIALGDRRMPCRHYRLAGAVAASISLLLVACSSRPPVSQASLPGAANSPGVKTAAADPQEGMDTESTIWTMLGLAKKPSEHQPGPRTGETVSPILWQAALDTLRFVKFTTQDPLTGELVTDWYSPSDKPNEQFKIFVFVLAHTVRSDAVAVTVERQERTATGQWEKSTVDRHVQENLETAILRRAGELKREWQKAYTEK
jgi:hypothetical protein